MDYDWRIFAILIVGMLIIGYLRTKKKRKVNKRMPTRDFPKEWRSILELRVPFYQKLPSTKKRSFEKQIHIFLLNYKISGHQTEVTDLDRILVAAGGVIPTFAIHNWHYSNLDEIIIFPNHFEIPSTGQLAKGLVGSGSMEGKLWLSRIALYKGFSDDKDQKNVAIHEFIHLMDMEDGKIDSILYDRMSEKDIEEWKEFAQRKADKVGNEIFSIRGYAKANAIEFLAVTGEFYFEDPDSLKSDHPELYRRLHKIFHPKKLL